MKIPIEATQLPPDNISLISLESGNTFVMYKGSVVVSEVDIPEWLASAIRKAFDEHVDTSTIEMGKKEH